MELEFYLYSLLLIPLVAGKAMKTVFGSSFAAYISQFSWLSDMLGINAEAAGLLTDLPIWMQQPWFVLTTFVLAIFEKRLENSPAFQDIWNLSESKFKGLFAFLLCTALIQVDPQLALEQTSELITEEAGHSEFHWEYVWAFIVGGLTWTLSAIRSGVMGFLIQIDEADSLGMRMLLRKFESAMGMFGPLLFIIMPIAALITAFMALLSILGLKWWVKKVENKHSRPCSQCQHINHKSALMCGNCEAELTDIKDVGFMGLSKAQPAGDKILHQQKLLRAKRCPKCATSSGEAGLNINCKVCHQPFFKDADEARIYIKNLKKRIPKTLGVTALCSFIPIIGLIPGIIFYQLYLVSGAKCYVSRQEGFMLKFMLRFLFIFLIIGQLTPLIGIAAIPIMAVISYLAYEEKLRNQIKKML